MKFIDQLDDLLARHVAHITRDRAITPALLTSDEAAKYLSVSPNFVQKLRNEKMITAVKIGRAVRYERAELDKFIKRNRS